MSGIYLHIPFCRQKCSYCDFHFSTTFEPYRKEMVQKLGEELSLRKDYLPERALRSVYFGGGTPSLLSAAELSFLMESVQEHFQLENDAEVTLEANPDDITPASLDAWKSIGINRLSIGIQSFREQDLQWMNRAHTVAHAEKAVELSRKAGFSNLTVDLIYGLPGLSLKEWEQHLNKVIAMGVDHVSAYCLTVEEQTALHNWVKKGKLVPADEELQSDQFNLMAELLTAHGFMHYEISNFARNGKYAVHNTSYWTGDPYLGIGPSAHSFNGSERRWNVANNSMYIRSVGKDDSWFDMEKLTGADRWNELILTGLRTMFGVDLQKLEEIQPITDQWLKKTDAFARAGLLIREGSGIRLTLEGKLQADHIASELFLV